MNKQVQFVRSEKSLIIISMLQEYGVDDFNTGTYVNAPVVSKTFTRLQEVITDGGIAVLDNIIINKESDVLAVTLLLPHSNEAVM